MVARSADKSTANISIQSAASSSRTYQGYGQEQTFIDTTVRVRMGEWFELGGNTDTRSSDSRGILHRTTKNEDHYNKIFMKVELSN